MVQLAVVFEADADRIIATELADRVVIDAIEWLDDTMLDAQRSWTTEVDGRQLRWKAIKRMARQRGLHIHGHFNGEPGLPDAAAARRAILLLKSEFAGLDAIVLIRDADKQGVRKAGLDQARKVFESMTVAIGLAIPEREAWVICGFEPVDEDETELLKQERATLGFDPRLRSHELTATNDDRAQKSPKRVLKTLTGDSTERERPCWQNTPLATLHERGKENGLGDYLADVVSKIVPLIGGVSQT